MERERTYVCIDLKSFYASVECVRRGLDPMTTRLVVADPTRSEMTICLAVSPAMKAAGVKNRCRLYEIPEGIDYITAQPRMTSYMEVSAEIYGTYLRYVSQEDIHPYSIDECFIDATPYLELYDLTAREFADTLDANPYKSWVDMYRTDEFWQGSVWLIDHIERLAADLPEERKQELVDIFITGVENEYMFWASAYDMHYSWKPEWDR